MKKETILQKEIRLKGYSLQEFAEKIGTYPYVLSKWCNGERRITAPMVRALKKEGISKKSIANPTQEA